MITIKKFKRNSFRVLFLLGSYLYTKTYKISYNKLNTIKNLGILSWGMALSILDENYQASRNEKELIIYIKVNSI